MNTKELIEALQKLDPEKEVAVLFDDGFDPIKKVAFDERANLNFIELD